MSEFLNKIGRGAAWTIGRMLPIEQNKIVISSYYGRGFGDNLRPIAEELLRRDKDLKIVWLTAGENAAASLPKGITAVEYNSLDRIKELSTAKVWLDNCRKGARQKREGQIYVQTWHGFALKRIEKDVCDTLGDGYEEYAMRDSAQTDLIVSDSRFMTEVYRRTFWYDGEIQEFGSPRNDALINGDEETYKLVRSRFELPEDCRIVLYAPTFRADKSMEPYSIDYARLRKSCEARFGGRFAVLIRLHPNIMKQAEELTFDNETTFDASAYQDMQELLSAADVVITDYSSLMFDFMLTRRPCFQYASDIEAYRNDRNFNFSLDKLPFPLAENNDELESKILGFDDAEYQNRLKKFNEEFGIIADGQAASRCVDWILDKMKG